MNLPKAWDMFYTTGSVYDYLAYRRENKTQEEQCGLEVHDRRTDNKRNQCR